MECPALTKYDALETKYKKRGLEVKHLRRALAQLLLIKEPKPERLIMTVTKDGKTLKVYETRKILSVQKQCALVKQFMREAGER